MKKMILGFIAVSVFLPVVVFAGPQDELAAFQAQQVQERKAFMEKTQEERISFFNSHPEITAYLQEQAKNAQAQAGQGGNPLMWRKNHFKRFVTGPVTSPSQ